MKQMNIQSKNYINSFLFGINIYRLPDWADYVLLNEMFNEIRKLMLQAPTYTEPMAKIRSGFFLKEILDRARTAKDPSAMEHSMYMYSAHGKTMANLLHTLKMLPVSNIP